MLLLCPGGPKLRLRRPDPYGSYRVLVACRAPPPKKSIFSWVEERGGSDLFLLKRFHRALSQSQVLIARDLPGFASRYENLSMKIG
jgi:hypothetical protein